MTLKRILIVTSEFPPQPGGIGNHAYNLAKALTTSGYTVEVISDQRSDSGTPELSFDTPLSFKIHRIKKRSWRTFMYLRRLMLLFKRIRSNDFIVASGKFSIWAVALISVYFNRKYIAVLHGTEVNFKQPLLKWSIDQALKRFTKLIAVSHFTKSLVKPKYHHKMSVIPNGYDVSKWAKSLPEKKNIHGNPVLITVGNVTERKGQIHVIRHLPRLVQEFPEIHYHCVGIPTDMNVLVGIAKDLGVEKRVTFHGQVSDTELQLLLTGSDVFVMLSGTTSSGDVEGFGIANLEANALGLPAIGALGSGIEDAIENYTSGVLIPLHDTEAFVRSLREVLTNYETYSARAKKWALKHTWQVVVKSYIAVLES